MIGGYGAVSPRYPLGRGRTSSSSLFSALGGSPFFWAVASFGGVSCPALGVFCFFFRAMLLFSLVRQVVFVFVEQHPCFGASRPRVDQTRGALLPRQAVRVRS